MNGAAPSKLARFGGAFAEPGALGNLRGRRQSAGGKEAMTQKLTDLAIFGGEPRFSASLHVGCPNIGSRERFLTRVASMLDSRRLSNNGPFVQELEAILAERLGVRHCIAVCNGTLALESPFRAGIAGRGDRAVVHFS